MKVLFRVRSGVWIGGGQNDVVVDNIASEEEAKQYAQKNLIKRGVYEILVWSIDKDGRSTNALSLVWGRLDFTGGWFRKHFPKVVPGWR